MDPDELAAARKALPGLLSTGLSRPDRVELAVAGSYEEIESALRGIGERSKSLQGRAIPVIAAREGAVLGRLRGLLVMVAGLVLAASGLAMAMSLAAGVAERRPEIGLLKALGAGGGRIVRLFAAQVGILLALGLGLGAAAGLLLSNAMSRGVFGVPVEVRPAALAAALLGCGAMGLFASIIPVRRALAVQPALVLKGE
jgi:putative ABC transport system permease protein